MPILLKHITAEIISLFGDTESSLTPSIRLIKSVTGEIGVETYIQIHSYEALLQDFSQIGSLVICDASQIEMGITNCSSYNELNISY